MERKSRGEGSQTRGRGAKESSGGKRPKFRGGLLGGLSGGDGERKKQKEARTLSFKLWKAGLLGRITDTYKQKEI